MNGHKATVSIDFLKTVAHLQFHLDQAVQPIRPNKLVIKVIGANIKIMIMIIKLGDPRMWLYFGAYLLPALIFDYDTSDGVATRVSGVARKFKLALFTVMTFLTLKH